MSLLLAQAISYAVFASLDLTSSVISFWGRQNIQQIGQSTHRVMKGGDSRTGLLTANTVTRDRKLGAAQTPFTTWKIKGCM